jgi:2-keto-4-pentenoate hydratase/2-oxohepta-3-ene-1,7-dioic acid hydratase in catechol pathway
LKLATFLADGRETWGIIEDRHAFDVGEVLSDRLPGLRELISLESHDEARVAVRSARRHSIEDIVWLPPIPRPGKILCVGLNYEEHRVETGREPTGHPVFFTRFADTQIGHKAAIIRPRLSTDLDYEGELAVVIGRPGRHIARDEALDHVAGYACYNDVTVRDWQRHTSQFTPGKNFPWTVAFGPALVTADEIGDYRSLRLETRLNGEIVQSAGLDQLIFSIPILIEYCSSFTALSPGDVIITGTPGGVGFKREPPLFMKPGDRVEVDITGVGLLMNTIMEESG